MNKNINQNYFLQVKKILGKVEKSADAARHFRCIVLMGDQQEPKAFSFMHASQEDMKNLVLAAMRNSEEFVGAAAEAFMQYDKELAEQSETKNNNKDEENQIQED